MSRQREQTDIIPVETAGTLDGLFRERMRRSPDGVAYRDYERSNGRWRDLTWKQTDEGISRWQAALSREGLARGDRVAVMLRNCPEWVMFEHAALRMGLVVVPLYTADRPENAAYVLSDAGARVLLLEELAQWRALAGSGIPLDGLVRVVTIQSSPGETGDDRVRAMHAWLPERAVELPQVDNDPHQLATIIYTSGTSGRPKGVMLSHHNILTNAFGCTWVAPLSRQDLLLSFLPLSHAFERTAGYYVPMMCGATVAYARSIQQLAEDLLTVRPTILVSVPRIYERVYAGVRDNLASGPGIGRLLFELTVEIGFGRFERRQGRGGWRPAHLLWPLLEALVARKVMARLGGRLRGAMSGGAALSAEISRVFIGLGLPLLQGYGMTESSPVVSSNTFDDNVPGTVGRPIPGVEVRLGEHDALLIRGPNVMLGYWNNPEATRAVLAPDGWLNSGDIARIDARGTITITGRLKEIIVMSTGEKIPPADMEAAILRDPLFEQAMLVGEGRSYLSVLAVLDSAQWEEAAKQRGLDADWRRLAHDRNLEEMLLQRIARQISGFPGYAKVYRVALSPEPWTIDNGLLTPTLKLRRNRVLERYQAEVDWLYQKVPA
jgi:long-chain acyl-CoA synthetase